MDKNLAKYSAIYHKRVSTTGMPCLACWGLTGQSALSLGCLHLWAAVKADTNVAGLEMACEEDAAVMETLAG